MSLIGERGRVRELWDLGDKMLLVFIFAVREAGRDVVVVVPGLVRLGFFGLESALGRAGGPFSLSERISISELCCFAPFLEVGRTGLGYLAGGDVTS